MSDNNICYPYRYGAYSSVIKSFRNNHAIAALFEHDAKKIEEFTKIIDSQVKMVEDLCTTYEAQYAVGL